MLVDKGQANRGAGTKACVTTLNSFKVLRHGGNIPVSNPVRHLGFVAPVLSPSCLLPVSVCTHPHICVGKQQMMVMPPRHDMVEFELSAVCDTTWRVRAHLVIY
jgi:hypothetical protein